MDEQLDRPLRVAFETFGCRSNSADTLDLQLLLSERGVVPVDAAERADVIVFNTCTVTDDAEKTALRAVRRAKAGNPTLRVIVTGCLAEVTPQLEHDDDIDRVVGTGKPLDVVAAVLGAGPGTHDSRSKPANVDLPLSLAVKGPRKPLGELNFRSRFHLRVQEGCENHCTFCIIPQTRGAYRSRPLPVILDDLRRLAELGYREVVLTGTHLGGYGLDSGSSLMELLEAVAENTPIPRIRISSLDPNDVPLDMIGLMSDSNVFCNHLHICVQSLSNGVLKRMNRRYRVEHVVRLFDEIERRLPACCVGGDLIVGFPGEGRKEVEEGKRLSDSLPISYLHVFPYSEREGTAAPRLDGAIPLRERKTRSKEWREASDRRFVSYLRGLIGKSVEVLAEGGGERPLRGTTREFATALLPESSPLAPGDITVSHVSAVDEGEQLLLCESLSQVS